MNQKKVMAEEVTNEQFALMLIESADQEDEEKKKRIRFLADKIAAKFDDYKKGAIDFLKDAEELDSFLARVDEKFKKLGKAGEKLAYIPEMIMLIRSYVIKEYTDISAAEIVAITAALLYFVSPLDVIPDSIPGIGILDDVLVVSVVIGWCDDDIDKYMKWRENR